MSNQCSSQNSGNIAVPQSSEENICTIAMPENQNTEKDSYHNKLNIHTINSLQKKHSRMISTQEQENVTLPSTTGWIGILILIFSTALSVIVTLWLTKLRRVVPLGPLGDISIPLPSSPTGLVAPHLSSALRVLRGAPWHPISIYNC